MPAHELKNTVYEFLKGTVNLKETIIERPVCVHTRTGRNGLSLVPSSLNLSGAEIEFSGLAGREFLALQGMTKIRSLLIYKQL